jgi:hypothetical protein
MLLPPRYYLYPQLVLKELLGVEGALNLDDLLHFIDLEPSTSAAVLRLDRGHPPSWGGSTTLHLSMSNAI